MDLLIRSQSCVSTHLTNGSGYIISIKVLARNKSEKVIVLRISHGNSITTAEVFFGLNQTC